MSWLSAELKRGKKKISTAVKGVAVGAATMVGGPMAGAAVASGLRALDKPDKPKPSPMPPQQVMTSPTPAAFAGPAPVVLVEGPTPVLQHAPSFSPPATVPEMPWSQFRGIMWEAYQKGRRGDVLT